MTKLINLKYFSISLMIFSALLAFTIQEDDIAKASHNDFSDHAPSPDPIYGYDLFSWKRGGFSKQPNKNYGLIEGGSTQIKTRSVWTNRLLDPLLVSHQWYFKKENSPWHPVSKGNTSSLTIKNLDTGTYYYQLVDNYNNFLHHDTFYSNIATVIVKQKQDYTNALKVDTDLIYLHSNPKDEVFDKTIDAIATPDPTWSNGKIHWTLSDKDVGKNDILENDLAKIDQNGLVTAKEKAQGELKITGYIKNPDNTIVQDTKKIKVGGGLDNQESRVGERAIFKIQTGENERRDNNSDGFKVTWYRIKKDKDNPKEISNNNSDPFILTTNILEKDDNDSCYYAVISIKGKSIIKKERSVTTNKAHLTVASPINSHLNLETTIENLNHPDPGDKNNTLENVFTGDNIEYTTHLTNNGTETLKDAELKYYLNLDCKLNSITVNGEKLELGQYKLIQDLPRREQILTLPINELPHTKNNQPYIVKFDITILDSTKDDSFSSSPSLTGINDKNQSFSANNTKELTLNFLNNDFKIDFKNINFDSIQTFEGKKTKYRSDETNSPNNVVTIIDRRRKPTKRELFVTQTSDFINTDDLRTILPATILNFYEPNVNPEPLKNNLVSISESENGKPMESIKWDKHQGILLDTIGKFIQPGKYQATLTWTLVDSGSSV